MRLSNPITLANLPETASTGDFTPIPAGIYDAEIRDAEIRATKAGNGEYLNLRADVIAGDHAGRVVFGMITISNPNQTAVEIGQGHLRALMRAVGLEQLQDTDQLVGRRCKIKVAIDSRDGYEPKNTIKAYAPIGNMAGKVQTSPRAAQPAAAAGQGADYGYQDSTPF
jgi:hypothetical protein